MTVRAPASARVAEIAVGEVGERVGAEQHQHLDATVGGRLRIAVVSRPAAPARRASAPANQSRPVVEA